MILNNATFDRVAKAAGYSKSMYYAGLPGGLVAFRVYDGPDHFPTRAIMVHVNEQFEIVRRLPHTYIDEDGVQITPA